MIEEEAYVAEVSAGLAWIERSGGAVCSGCAQACPSSLSSGLFGKKPVRLQVASNLPLRPGDRVVVGVSEKVLTVGSFCIYLLPLLALFGGALLGQFLNGSDLASATGGLVGLGLCYAALKAIGLFDREGYQPVILRRID